ncbi:helix-turn-helix domain-containing protein [Cellulosimicrobium sp. Marseille-Q8652]
MAAESSRQTAIEMVRVAMSERGLTAASLSRDTGVHVDTIRDFVNGKRWPRAASLRKIEDNFGWATGYIDRVARGVEQADVTAGANTGHGVYLDVDPKVLEDLSPEEREEALTATKARAAPESARASDRTE